MASWTWLMPLGPFELHSSCQTRRRKASLGPPMEMARWTDHREIPHGKAKKSGVAKVRTRVSNLVGVNSGNVSYLLQATRVISSH